jgi:phosphoenolpyruvate carboxylase
VGEALRAELDSHPAVMKDMHTNWPWFRTLIDLLDLICAKSEPRIAQNYDHQLLRDANSIELGNDIRQKFEQTKHAVLALSGATELQQGNNVLRRSLQVRNPYVDPLNIIQAEVLKRLRERKGMTEEQKRLCQDTLLITINGIANGMRNSG